MRQSLPADLGVVTDYEPWAGLVRIPFIQEPLCVIGPRDAGLDFAKPIDLREVADLPLILPSRPNTFRLIIETALWMAEQFRDPALARLNHVLGRLRPGN
jgi:DNA-binding transcriptional LysR family regulator